VRSPSGELEVLGALRETGAIGSTVRQIAERLSSGRPEVALTLERLRGRGAALQIGRGLWILSDFERLESRPDFVDPASFEERFAREEGVSLGRYRGPITFSSNDELPVHRWWPYVQGYSAEFVRTLLDSADLSTGATVLDPFCGSGTTAVEARRAGYRAVGLELLPPAVLAARVKCRFELDGGELERECDRLVERARARPAGALPFLSATTRQFAPDVLDELTRLRDALPPGGTDLADAMRLAFGRILIPVSRLERSPCLGYRARDRGVSLLPFDAFRSAAREMHEDLGRIASERPRWGPPTEVLELDARALDIGRERVDLAVTSPPYVNGMDYVTNYKLDLAWLGYSHSYADLTRLRRQLVACDNLPRADFTSRRGPDRTPDPWLPEILERIRANVRQKRTYRRDDVHAIVLRYFLDLEPVLRRIRDALKPGGRFHLVVGDSLLAGAYVPGDLLIARLGRSAGLSITSVEVARPRRSGQRRSFSLRESIVTLQKPR
jgi:SAM-dependent methyltransferase